MPVLFSSSPRLDATPHPTPHLKTGNLLRGSVQAWFVVLMVAQLCFVLYLLLGYGHATLSADLARWNQFNSGAFEPSNPAGNLAYGLHVLLAVIMIAGGPLQLIPALRARYWRLHKINGYTFVTLAVCISMASQYLLWTRGTVGSLSMHLMTSFSGIVVVVSAIMAVKAARNKRIAIHQVWAVRLFLAANSVLFFRILLFGWLMIFGQAGIDFSTFSGPAVVAISIGSYLLPLLMFEWYRYGLTAQSGFATVTITMAMGLAVICFSIGTFGVVVGNWYPALFPG
ncbi:DUF2306 domain-containing protein [Salinimonas marina]|uniref:DUF2306 domain-containing protein n=1 Tax=Salinimonas marina TaxID=2785918 RepID=A0A7S9HE60_9ALTE|nr:DUF2306 domain-containing protein [Salinimonas marina]QPG06874.1 DUF2306 domain-containing protein [Salinimonas marina]